MLRCGLLFLDLVFTGLRAAPDARRGDLGRGMGSSPGGIANLAVAASRLGLRTSLATAFGDDVYGDYCWRGPRGPGGRRPVHVPRAPTTGTRPSPSRWPSTATAPWSPTATPPPSAPTSHDRRTRPAPAPLVAPSRATSRSAPGTSAPGPRRPARRRAASSPTSAGTPPGRGPPALLDQLALCHAFLPNAAEAMAYTRTDSPRAALGTLAELVPLAVVTGGADGAMAVDPLPARRRRSRRCGCRRPGPDRRRRRLRRRLRARHARRLAAGERLRFAGLAPALSVAAFGGSLAAPGWGDIADWWHEVRAAAGDQRAPTALAGPPLRLPRRSWSPPYPAARSAGRPPPSPGTPTSGPTGRRKPPQDAEHPTSRGDGHVHASRGPEHAPRACAGAPSLDASPRSYSPPPPWPSRDRVRARLVDPPSRPARRRRCSTDAAALGNVTLTVWDQEVRGGQDDADEAAQRRVRGEVPQHQAQAGLPLLRRPRHHPAPGAERQRSAGRGAGQQRPLRRWARSSKAGQLRPLDAYAEAYGWNERYPESVRATRAYSADGKVFGAGNLYGLPQVGEVVGIYYNNAKLTSLGMQPPTTWAEFQAALADGQGRPARCRCSSATSTSGRPSTCSASCRAATSRPTRSAPWASAARARSWTTPENTKAAADARRLGRQGLLQQGLQRAGLRPGVAGVQQGQRRLPHRRHLADGRHGEGHGQRRGLHAAARARRPAGRPSRPAAGPAVRHHRKSPKNRTRRRRTSTSSPTPTP